MARVADLRQRWQLRLISPTLAPKINRITMHSKSFDRKSKRIIDNYQLGFEHSQSFSKLFKKNTNQTPLWSIDSRLTKRHYR